MVGQRIICLCDGVGGGGEGKIWIKSTYFKMKFRESAKTCTWKSKDSNSKHLHNAVLGHKWL